MNIRVNLATPISDGTEVVFRSPVDCSQVTGLKVYYRENGNSASKEFAFADAHGNNVGDIDHLFAENVVVKVILDVTHAMAFVQNADTNAYIERTFIKTVNGIAPDENGNVVVEVPEGGGGSGVTAAEKELILSLFKNTAYTANMSATISRLESLWSGSGDEPDEPVEPDIPDEPDVIMHNITKKLDGVIASNSATSVVDGAYYVCNLTAHDGYTLDGAEVSVAMGGMDITSTAYSNGVINIASVTGDVDITVVAREILIYSVTNNLTGVTNSNDQTEVSEGGSYSAILTIVDGYTLNSLVITMGGVDITDTVYGDGYVNIFEVTGDIVITAIGEAPSAFYELPSPLTFTGVDGQTYDTGVTDLYDADNPGSFTLLIDFECANPNSWNDHCIFEFGSFYMRITPASGRNRFYWRSNVLDIALTSAEKLAITHKAEEPYSVTIHYLKEGVYTSSFLTAHASSLITDGTLRIGYHSALGGAFVGTVNDLKLYHDVIPEADILAYLGVE